MSTPTEEWAAAWAAAVKGAAARPSIIDLTRGRPPQSIKLILEPGPGLPPEELLLRLDAGGLSLSPNAESADLSLSGDLQAWQSLLRREAPFMQQVNIYHGSLRWGGDAAAIAWAAPVLQELFEPPQRFEKATDNTKDADAPIDIAGRYVPIESGVAYADVAGEGTPVLLLHTAGRDARQWHPVMGLLAGNFLVVAPDLPGRGRSAPIPGEGCLTSVDDIVAWIIRFVDQLGFQEYLVAGCSLGGNLSLLLGARDSRVRGIVALQGSDFTPTMSESSLAVMDDPVVSLPHSNMPFTMSLVGTATAKGPRDEIVLGVQTLNSVAQKADLTAYSRCDFRSETGHIRQPVILFRGKDDWIVDASLVEGTASRLTNAASVDIQSVPGVGHFPHIEAPEMVAAAIRRVHGQGPVIE